MKILKNIYVLIVVACSVISLWVVNAKQTEQSDFLLRNVEALANEEGQNKYLCLGEGSVTCPVTGKGVEYVFILSK